MYFNSINLVTNLCLVQVQTKAEIASSILKGLVTNNDFDRLRTETSVGAQTSTWDDVTWSHASVQKKANVPTLGQILSQISEGGEGNRGQMPYIRPGSPRPPRT